MPKDHYNTLKVSKNTSQVEMKQAYIIPGFGQTAKTAGFSVIRKMFQRAGYNTTIVHIDWKYHTMTDWVQQYLNQYKIQKSKTVVLGFSYGAMIAAIAQQQTKANTLLLCSLSPYFKEDLPRIKQWWKTFIGKRRVADFKRYVFNDIAKTIRGRVYLVAGDAESVFVDHRINEAHRRIPKSKLYTLSDVKHDISDKRYLQQIQEIIEKMIP